MGKTAMVTVKCEAQGCHMEHCLKILTMAFLLEDASETLGGEIKSFPMVGFLLVKPVSSLSSSTENCLGGDKQPRFSIS